jgi:hypothetical protein
MLSRFLRSCVVMIVDNEDGVARLLTIDDSGVTESPCGDMAVVAGELAANDPDLILVNRSVLSEPHYALVDELNRRAPFRQAYAWRGAPGELPA